MPNGTKVTSDWASLEDLEEVWRLHESSGSTHSHPKPFFEESLRYNRVLLARDVTTAIAYLVYEVLWGNTAFVSLLRVLPEYQRKGIGTTLMRQLEERLRSQGFKSYVTSSETVNQNTKRFLPNLGLLPIGELQMQHGGELFYLKPLS